MATIQCPDCGKWVPDYADECYDCGYIFDECDCECYCDDEDDYDTKDCPCCYKTVPDYADECYGCGHKFYSSSYSSHSYSSNYGAKQCSCGKWVPHYAKKCWTCNSWF